MRRPLEGAVLAVAAAGLYAGPAQPAQATAARDKAKIEALTREVEALKALVLQLQAQVARTQAAEAAGASPAEIAELRAEVRRLQQALAAKSPPPPEPVRTLADNAAAQPPAAPPPQPAPQAPPSPASPGPGASGAAKVIADALRGVTINGVLDTYYEYNTNAPIGRVNLLRAYDVTSNNFSLNQADLIVESAPDPDRGKRFGLRLDLQYGQATATLQGNPANEPRPEVYRNIYQAFGTYVFPVGKSLSVDFGKWASSLGYEGNYTKDQLNYSRSFWFDFLPFYHTGLRVKYQLNDLFAANLWIVNGTQQAEAFNNYKDQMYGFVLTPSPQVSWTLNYYRGQEHPDVVFLTALPPGASGLPSQQGTFIAPIPHPATGLLNIGDTYLSWQATRQLLFAVEADYVEQRLFRSSPQQLAYGGALYAGYQITPQVAVAARGELLADRGGLFSGVVQNLSEGTFTVDWRPADGFLFRGEYRLDSAGKRYFLTSRLGALTESQPTIGFGAVWWFGQKPGAW